MSNENYVKGRAAEYYMMDVLKKAGYIVTRAAASKGVYDVIGLSSEGAVAIQAKRGKVAPSPSEWAAARDADLHGSIVRMVVWIPDGLAGGRLQPRVLWCSHPAIPFWAAHAGWQMGKPERQPRLALRA